LEYIGRVVINGSIDENLIIWE